MLYAHFWLFYHLRELYLVKCGYYLKAATIAKVYQVRLLFEGGYF